MGTNKLCMMIHWQSIWKLFRSIWGKTDFGLILRRLFPQQHPTKLGILPSLVMARTVFPHSRLLHNLEVLLDSQLLLLFKEQMAVVARRAFVQGLFCVPECYLHPFHHSDMPWPSPYWISAMCSAWGWPWRLSGSYSWFKIQLLVCSCVITAMWAALAASQLLSAIYGAVSYLQSSVWHRACISEGPLMSSTVVSACLVIFIRVSSLQVLSIKCCHILRQRKCAFSVMVLILWNIPYKMWRVPCLAEFWKTENLILVPGLG